MFIHNEGDWNKSKTYTDNLKYSRRRINGKKKNREPMQVQYGDFEEPEKTLSMSQQEKLAESFIE